MVRAKFRVDKIERSMSQRPNGKKDAFGVDMYEPCELQTVELNAVYKDGDSGSENSKFWQYTPAGSIRLSLVRAEAVAEFKLGEEMYIDFHPVVK